MKHLAHLNRYFVQYKWHMGLGVLFIILSNIFQVYAPQVVRGAFDMLQESIEQYNTMDEHDRAELTMPSSVALVLPLIGQDPADWLKLDNRKQLAQTILSLSVVLAVLYLVLALLKSIFLFFTRQTLIVMSRHIEYDLKNEIFDHYQRLDLAFYKRNNTGDLMNRISEDVSRVRMYLGPAVMYTINLVVLFILAIGAMLSVSPMLTMYVLIPLPIMSVLIYYVSTIINRKSEEVQRQQSLLSTMSQEAFSGIRVLKAFNKELQYSQRFDDACKVYRKRQLSLVKVDALFMPTIILLIGLSTMLAIYVGGVMVINGRDGITVGNIAEFVIYVNMLTWPFAAVGWVTSLVQRASASQERINEFLKQEPEIRNERETDAPIRGKIEFRNVSFRYPDTGIQALKGVSFCVDSGKTLAILGRTGSGKSTIANLVARLFEADSGEILVDDQPIREHNLYHLRRSIGYVPQDVFLFSDSIANNISFGLDPSAEFPDKIREAARKADVLHNIEDFREQFETVLGERGITLSGGQKQRVSIARAIAKDPKILILDDCLSAVDTETEENILQNLKSVMKHKTAVIISHRASSVKSADHILILDEGLIAEEGTHEELIEKQGLYFDLYQQQLAESQKITDEEA
ncbi:MAG: ABC transporter ATP-binding protein [Cryomorphaceae bacterium]|nr:MAG: ABC transporter ATP-binding protein [Cryomorphaceae bacterium]